MTVSDKRVERSKAAIRSAALEVLRESGVSAVTVDAIACRSGVSKATIYRHWTCRAALVKEVVSGALEVPEVIDTGDFAADLRASLLRLEAVLASENSEIIVSMLGAAEHDPEIAELRDNMARERSAIAVERMRKAQERGEIRSDISPADLHLVISGPLFYARMRHGAGDRSSIVDQIMTVVMPYLKETCD